jgi:hypothetical protein
MNAPTRLVLFGAGLVAAFGATYGLAGIAVPDSAVSTWQDKTPTNDHIERHSTMSDKNSDAHDHAADGGPAPAGIEPATDAVYPVGTRVTLLADHMPSMSGAEATISGAFDTTTYAVSYTPTTGGDPVLDHRWVVHQELGADSDTPLPDGAQAVLHAEHMSGMDGAMAMIDSSTTETVYMVDLDADGMTMTNHKWVVESEIAPLP